MSGRSSNTARWIAAALLAGSASAAFASPTLYGSLSNFDVYNDTGSETHGFEIELHGVSAADVSYTFGGDYNRYGSPRIDSFADGIYVRYLSAYDAINRAFLAATPVPTRFSPTDGHSCWSGGGAGYAGSGCEHFGLGLTRNATSTAYRWLRGDTATGQISPVGSDLLIAAPVWQVIAPPPPDPGQPAAAPVVQAVIEPLPSENHAQFGDAQWVKVFTTEIEREVELNELLSDSDVVPREQSETEIEWVLFQALPADRHNGEGDELVLERPLAGDAGGRKSVIRRYEFYEYLGAYDPEDHEAQPLDESDPVGAGEVGRYMGAQMAAANIIAAPVPEPASWLSMLGGLGVLGLLHRRRRA